MKKRRLRIVQQARPSSLGAAALFTSTLRSKKRTEFSCTQTPGRPKKPAPPLARPTGQQAGRLRVTTSLKLLPGLMKVVPTSAALTRGARQQRGTPCQRQGAPDQRRGAPDQRRGLLHQQPPLCQPSPPRLHHRKLEFCPSNVRQHLQRRKPSRSLITKLRLHKNLVSLCTMGPLFPLLH